MEKALTVRQVSTGSWVVEEKKLQKYIKKYDKKYIQKI